MARRHCLNSDYKRNQLIKSYCLSSEQVLTSLYSHTFDAVWKLISPTVRQPKVMDHEEPNQQIDDSISP
ncbi:hypothetical protein QYF36_016715 [Acer negundo]|nr:hypothetical protein QYF36_016715 [Acer negundo]